MKFQKGNTYGFQRGHPGVVSAAHKKAISVAMKRPGGGNDKRRRRYVVKGAMVQMLDVALKVGCDEEWAKDVVKKWGDALVKGGKEGFKESKFLSFLLGEVIAKKKKVIILGYWKQKSDNWDKFTKEGKVARRREVKSDERYKALRMDGYVERREGSEADDRVVESKRTMEEVERGQYAGEERAADSEKGTQSDMGADKGAAGEVRRDLSDTKLQNS